MNQVIVDTGPLVAYVQENEERSEWAQRTFDRLSPPFLTCEPVLTEACFLIARGGGDPDDLLDLVERGLLRVDFAVGAELPRVRALRKRYRNLPMSLADACLVRMTEQTPASRVITFDSHFRIYRRHDRRAIPLLMPED